VSALASRNSFKGDIPQSPYIALTLTRRRDDPPGQNFVHDGGLASVMQRLAGSVERLAYCLSGGVIKNAARNGSMDATAPLNQVQTPPSSRLD